MSRLPTALRLLSATLLLSACSQAPQGQVPEPSASAALRAQAVTGKFTGNGIMVMSGQTTDGITNYSQTYPGKYAGVTLYVNPALQTSGFTGGNTPAWYASGYGNQDLTVAKNDTNAQQALAVGIWMGQAYDTDIAKAIDPSKPWQGNIQNSIDGAPVGTQLLQNMRSIITDLKNSGRPVFVRLGYEAEGPWNGYWPDAYKTVWSWFKAEIGRQGASNIALVWQLAAWCDGGVLAGSQPISPTGSNSNGQGPVGGNLAAYYDQWWPGSSNVDWTGISVFDQNQTCSNGLTAVQNVVNYLKGKGKPIMIAESTPRGYTLAADGQVKFEQVGRPTRTGLTGQTVWNEWYAPFFNFIEANSNDIRAVAYINDDWEAYSHWQCSLSPSGAIQGGCAEGEWGNSRLGVNATVRNNWLSRINNGQYQFVVGSGTGGGGGGGDTAAPTTPGTLSSPAKTSSSVNLTWGASTDNVGVARYEIHVNNALAGTSTGTSFTATGLSASTAYSFKVRAVDAAGNASAFNAPISVTTSAASGSVAIPGTVTTSAGSIASGTTRSFAVNATQNAKYKFLVTSTSSQNSQLITVSFNGETVQQAIDAGRTNTVYFQGVTSGNKTLSIRADSGAVSIGRVDAQTW
ncbi:hypothetical protein GO986_06510 [Deinococcus sp. HMF7620]|uniref:Uncharacterized protein n=1 Tax=Deinococcus arboris TaxID=2682977 RepID=A0A7C9HYV1_9DEIO|nr:hypothetical protein [Deinococcus arboris]MVN86415.1 hypothetical protein [Deinococcus arboris]